MLSFIVSFLNIYAFIWSRSYDGPGKLTIKMGGYINLFFGLLNILCGFYQVSSASTLIYKGKDFVTTMDIRKEMKRDTIVALPKPLKKKRVVCSKCNGYGYHLHEKKERICPKCHGYGEYFEESK